MATTPAAQSIAAELTVPERLLLFYLALATDWQKAGVTHVTAQHMMVRNLIERDWPLRAYIVLDGRRFARVDRFLVTLDIATSSGEVYPDNALLGCCRTIGIVTDRGLPHSILWRGFDCSELMIPSRINGAFTKYFLAASRAAVPLNTRRSRSALISLPSCVSFVMTIQSAGDSSYFS